MLLFYAAQEDGSSSWERENLIVLFHYAEGVQHTNPGQRQGESCEPRRRPGCMGHNRGSPEEAKQLTRGLIPHVSLVIFDFMFFEHRDELVFEGLPSMVLLLVLDVSHHGIFA